MSKWLTGVAGVTAVILAIAGATFAIDAASDDGNSGPRSGDEARCLPGAEDCDDTPGQGDVAGICLEGAEDCVDTVDGGGVGLGVCAPDVPDCNDMIVVPDGGEEPGSPDEPVSNVPTSGDDIDPDECNAVHNIDACESQAVEAAARDLEIRGVAAAKLVSAEFTEWPDSCLGIETPGIACAQVITPGFKLLFEADGQTYEYHADLNGNVVLAE